MPDEIATYVEDRDNATSADADVDMLVVIVCYKAVELTIDCLESLAVEVEMTPGLRVAVCENGTGEEATHQLAEAIAERGWSDWVSLCEVSPNRGFTGGNNAILADVLNRECMPEFVVLLNADTVVAPNCLNLLRSALSRDPRIAAVGPKLIYGDGAPQQSCHRFPTLLTEFLRAAGTGILYRLFFGSPDHIPRGELALEPDWICFACAMIRTEVLKQVGLLDEGYFLYFDDPDLCRRIRNAGWQIRFIPEATVTHFHGQSNPVEQLRAKRQRPPKYYYESRARYFAKYYGRFGLYGANVAWHCGRLISLLREIVGSKERHLSACEARDIWTNWRSPLSAADPGLAKDGKGNLIRRHDDVKQITNLPKQPK